MEIKNYNIAIGVSGTGTTFEAIAAAVNSGKLNMNISFLFADRKCAAIEKAQKMHIPVLVREKDESLDEFHARVRLKLLKKEVYFVALAGYLRLFPVTKSDPYLVINSHPAAIPYFGGKGMWGIHVHQAVIKWAQKTNFKYPYTFSTVHVAGEIYDTGSKLGIKSLEIKKTDTPATLASRLLPLEHQNYIEVLERLSKNLVKYFEYPDQFLALVKRK